MCLQEMQELQTLASVSVVIPCFNSAKTIERAIHSVLEQTMLPTEIIIVDDASSDETLGVVDQFRGTPLSNVIVIGLKENSGPSRARNIGWERTVTDYVAFLDADDFWLPQKLAQVMDFFSQHPNTVACGHRFAVLNAIARTESAKNASAVDYSYHQLLIRNQFSTPAMVVKRDIAPRFPEHLRGAEDYALWLDIAFQYGPIPKLSKVLAGSSKSLYGESGLSSHLVTMELAVLSVIGDQRHSGRISLAQYLALILWSSFKFMVRTSKTFFRKFLQKK
ncbi:MAG TPA: glycosyltransferase family 2 protein [Methylophilaceae bacterium]|jgi:hypothetical protein|nr:glycosyltransferase family 2 protein [Methylophilaceae bacterium]